eukprot:g4991.t1
MLEYQPLDKDSTSPTNSSSQSSTFQVRVKTNDDQRFTIDLPPQATVGMLKQLLAEASGVPALRQRVIYQGKMLTKSSELLSTYKMEEGSWLHMIPRPEGCNTSYSSLNDSPDRTMHHDPNVLPPEMLEQFQRELHLARVLEGGPPTDHQELERALWHGAPIDLLRWRNSTKLVASILLFYFGVGLSAAIANEFGPELPDEQRNDRSSSRNLSEGAKALLSLGMLLNNIFGVWASFNLLRGAVILNLTFTRKFFKCMLLVILFDMLLNFEWGADFSREAIVISCMINQVIRLSFFMFCIYTVKSFMIPLRAYHNRVNEARTENNNENNDNNNANEDGVEDDHIVEDHSSIHPVTTVSLSNAESRV